MKKIYVIWWDNNQAWDDHASGISGNDAYSEKAQADEVCAKLNAHVFVPSTIEEYNTFGYEMSYEEYVEMGAMMWDQDRCTYSVIELNLI